MEAEQARQLAAVQETMRELGDDVLSAFSMPGDKPEMAFDGAVGGELERTHAAVSALHSETSWLPVRVDSADRAQSGRPAPRASKFGGAGSTG